MYFPTVDASALISTLQDVSPAVRSAIIFVGEESRDAIPSLLQGLNQTDLKYCGGIFPGIIHDNSNTTSGMVVWPLTTDLHISVVSNLSEQNFDSLLYLDLLEKIEMGKSKPTLLTLVDGLSSAIEPFLNGLFQSLGNKTSYIGGGCGSISLEPTNCIFTQNGIEKDAALLALLPVKSSLAVQHGWRDLHGPLVATRTNGNRIEELNWENAFSVYKNQLDLVTDTSITADNFFSIAMQYPFGIYKEDEERVVRDPISVTPEGYLNCVGAVPSNTVVYILQGNPDTLLKSAQDVQNKVLDQLNDNPIETLLVIDCISRAIFLEDQISEELSAITQATSAKNKLGALTLGEIATTSGGTLEFHNKTIVVGAIHG